MMAIVKPILQSRKTLGQIAEKLGKVVEAHKII